MEQKKVPEEVRTLRLSKKWFGGSKLAQIYGHSRGGVSSPAVMVCVCRKASEGSFPKQAHGQLPNAV
jgi:hypothetical protein